MYLFFFQWVHFQLKQVRPQRNTNSKAEVNLARYFANFHARLQILESTLREDVAVARNWNYHRLSKLSTELEGAIGTLQTLIEAATPFANGGGNEHKLDVQTLREKLKEMLEAPCYLIGQGRTSEDAG